MALRLIIRPHGCSRRDRRLQQRRPQRVGVKKKQVALTADVIGVNQNNVAAHERLTQRFPVNAKIGKRCLRVLHRFAAAALGDTNICQRLTPQYRIDGLSRQRNLLREIKLLASVAAGAEACQLSVRLLGFLDERGTRLGFDALAVGFGGFDFRRGLLGRLVDLLGAFLHGHRNLVIGVDHFCRRVQIENGQALDLNA